MQTGPGSWTSTVDGITTVLRITPAAPRAGEVVHFSATATYAGAGCCFGALNPGIGNMALSDGSPDRCVQPLPSTAALVTERVFPGTGPILVHVSFTVMPCGPPPPGLPEGTSLPMGSLHASITIAAAA
jgi:hypothetical protein